MIQFNKDGTVTVTDHYWPGYETFRHREIKEGERLEQYFDGIMNHFWFNMGKNKRRYDK